MDFISADQYSKSNSIQFKANSQAASDLASLHHALGPEDRWDRGQRLFDLQFVFQIAGRWLWYRGDHSGHCSGGAGRSGDSRGGGGSGSVSCLTSFFCLHFVPDMPAAVSLFNKVLEVGGKFVFIIPTSWRFKIVFDEMREEERWRELLSKAR